MEAAGIEPALGALGAALPRGSLPITPGPLLVIPANALPEGRAGAGPESFYSQSYGRRTLVWSVGVAGYLKRLGEKPY